MFPDLTRDDVFRIETARLWLRWPRGADAAALVRLAGEKAVAEMTAAVPHPYGPEDANAFVLRARRENMEGAALTLAIAPRGRPVDLIGTVSIHPGRTGPEPELGYWIGTPYWGDGFATEAARATVDAFFSYTPGAALAATTRVINPASRRVLEKCGFSPSGEMLQPFPARGGIFPVHRFGLDREGAAGLDPWWAAGRPPGEALSRV